MQSATALRLLALAPGTSNLGVAVFTGEALVKFCVKRFPGKKTERTLAAEVERCLDKLFARYRPNTVVVEEAFYAQAKASPLLGAMTETIRRWGRKKGLRTKSYVPTTVKEHFCEDRKKTRRALAEAMVRLYPFLARDLKETRTQRGQEYWWQMTDAVALGAFVGAKDDPRTLGAG